MTVPGRADVLIVGAGVAGSAAATVLARAGVRVALVDRQARCAPCFKAEKLEPDQARLLRELGLFEGVRPLLTPIRSVASAVRGVRLECASLEQYGVDYWELANALRDQVPPSVEQRVERVRDAEIGDGGVRVLLGDGSALEARLLVLACGTSPSLNARLGIERVAIRAAHSFAFGFDVALERPPRDCDSLTYYAERVASRLDYLTLFPIGLRWRGNLFCYLDPRGARVRDYSRDAAAELRRDLPRLSACVGSCEVAGKVEGQVIDLYRVEGPVRGGLALIGDAHQSVCPATGTGLSKVLTDVKVVCERIPGWLAAPHIDREALCAYYRDPRKLASDAHSLAAAEHRRNFSTRSSLRWRLHRTRTYLGAGLRARLGAGGRRDGE